MSLMKSYRIRPAETEILSIINNGHTIQDEISYPSWTITGQNTTYSYMCKATVGTKSNAVPTGQNNTWRVWNFDAYMYRSNTSIQPIRGISRPIPGVHVHGNVHPNLYLCIGMRISYYHQIWYCLTEGRVSRVQYLSRYCTRVLNVVLNRIIDKY